MIIKIYPDVFRNLKIILFLVLPVVAIYILKILSTCNFSFFLGKLGHGDTNRVYKPKVIEALQGMFIRKVCAGSQSSLALTSTGQVGKNKISLRQRHLVFKKTD